MYGKGLYACFNAGAFPVIILRLRLEPENSQIIVYDIVPLSIGLCSIPVMEYLYKTTNITYNVNDYFWVTEKLQEECFLV